MTSRTLRRFLGSLLLVGALLAPTWLTALATAPVMQQAGPVVIGFDDLDTTTWGSPGQTVLSDQYANLGVTFNNPRVLDYAGGGFGDPDFAHSGSNAIQHCYSQETCRTPLVMTFSEPQQRVKVWVGLRDGIDEAVQVTITAFDAAQGGNAVGSASATLGPSGPSIPVQVPLEVAANGTIQRAEVTYSPQSDAASQLVVDDVEFEPAPGQVDCLDGTLAPEISLDQPTTGSEVQIDDMTLQGRVATSAPLTRSTLTVVNDRGISSRNVLSILPRAGGKFGPIVVDNVLRPGVNRISLTASNCVDADPARATIVYAPIDPDTQYELWGLEVTQTIQDMANSVPLIADKRTFVRVYLRTIEGTRVIGSVTGKLRGCAYADESTAFVQPDEVQPGVVQLDDAQPDDAQQECLGTPAEFLPLEPLNPIVVNDTDDVTTQRLNLQMPVDDPETTDVNEADIPPIMNYGLLFELPPEWVQTGHLRLQFDKRKTSLSPYLECGNCDAITDVTFVDALPVDLNLADARYELDGKPYEPHDIDHRRIESWLERAYPTDTVTVSALAELPLKQPPSNCYEVKTALFEAESHAVLASPSSPLDERARYYGLVASPSRDLLVGCSTEHDEGESIDRYAAGPAGCGDNYVWDKDGSYADFYAGHEIGHTFLRKHPGLCDQSRRDDDLPPAFKDGYISDKTGGYVGFDSGAYRDVGDIAWLTTYKGDSWYDMMTYCDNRWISAYTYECLADQMGDQPVWCPVVKPGAETAAPPALEPIPQPAPGQRVLVVSGIVDTTSASFIPRPLSVLPGDMVSPRPAKSTFTDRYTINLIDDVNNNNNNNTINGVPLVTTYLFNPRIFTDQPESGPQFAQIAEVVPWVEGTDTIEIRSGTTLLETIDVNTPPTVTLLSPNGGEPLGGARFRVAWESSDLETPTDELTHTLLYSTDDGVTWQTAAGNITGQEYLVDPDRLPGSDHALFRIIVTDGLLTAQDDSDDPFTVTDKPPRVEIVSPHDGATFTSASTVVLTGHATDIELGELDATMEWADTSQSPPVSLGTGRSVGVPNLTPGMHTITLTAEDDKHHVVTDTITITITDANPPHLVWPEPVLPGVRQGQFVYDGDDGVGAFYTTDGAGGIGRIHGFDPLLNGLTAIVPGNFGGDNATDLLFYASQSGVGEFFASNGEGELQLLSGSEGFTRGWDIIVPGDFGGDDWTDLFFYNADEGEGKFYTTNGAGTIRLLSALRGLPTGWTSMVAGQFGGDGDTDLLFYDAATGLAQLYTTDGEGGLELLGADLPLGEGWDQIVTGNFGSRDGWLDLFVYDDETGNTRFLTADGTGEFAQLDETAPFPAGLTSVIGGEFGGDEALTDLFFYDANAGQGSYYTTDAKGGLQQLSSSGDYPTGWDQIVPGYFESP